MFIKASIIVIFIWNQSVTAINYRKNNDLFDLITSKISQEYRIHEIVVFFNKEVKANDSLLDSALERISDNISAIFFDSSKVYVSYRNLTLESSSLQYFRRNYKHYIIFQYQHEFHIEELQRFIKFVAQLHYTRPRSKILVILFNKNNLQSRDYKQLFLYSWSLKFIHFTIILVNNHQNNSLILSYNPFTKTYYKRYIFEKNSLFPDKLKNMHGYSITTCLINKPPVSVIKKLNGQIVASGNHYKFIDELSTALNFTLKFLEINDITITDVQNKLRNNKINISPIAFPVGLSMYGKKILIGDPVTNFNMYMIGPIKYAYKLSNFKNIFIHLSLSAAIISFLFIIGKLLKFTFENWTIFYIFQILLTVVASKAPTRHYDKIIYLSIVFTSIKYSADTFALLTDDNVVTKSEVLFDTLEQLRKPLVPIYMNKELSGPSTRDGNTDYIESIYRNIIKVDSVVDCFKKLVEKRDRFCMASETYATFYIEKYRHADGGPLLKLSSPPLFYDYSAFGFESGSPFTEKFNKVFKMFSESGISNTWKFGKKSTKVHDREAEITPNRRYTINLLIILFLGYSISLLTFFIEFFV